MCLFMRNRPIFGTIQIKKNIKLNIKFINFFNQNIRLKDFNSNISINIYIYIYIYITVNTHTHTDKHLQGISSCLNYIVLKYRSNEKKKEGRRNRRIKIIFIITTTTTIKKIHKLILFVISINI